MFLIGFLVLVSFFFSNYILPYSNRQARMLLYDIRRKRPDINLQAGSFNNDIDGFSIKITSKDPLTNRLDGLIIYDHRDKKGNISVTTADSGYMKITPDETAMIMTLYNGKSHTEIDEKNVGPDERKYPARKDEFKEQTVVISLSGFDLERSSDDLFRSTSWMLNLAQLSFYVDSLNTEYNTKYNQQYKEFRETRVLTERNIMFNIDGKIDNPGKDSLTFNPESLYGSLRNYDKRVVVAQALDKAKEAANFLSMTTETMKMQIRFVKRYEVDWHKKLVLPFGCLVFFFIGAPLGAIVRKGGLGTPTVISILFFVIWYVISMSAEKLVEENLISSFAGMWASSYILLPIGIFLTYKASNDSMIMNVDTYIQFFRKIKDFIYRIVIQGKRLRSELKNKSDE